MNDLDRQAWQLEQEILNITDELILAEAWVERSEKAWAQKDARWAGELDDLLNCNGQDRGDGRNADATKVETCGTAVRVAELEATLNMAKKEAYIAEDAAKRAEEQALAARAETTATLHDAKYVHEELQFAAAWAEETSERFQADMEAKVGELQRLRQVGAEFQSQIHSHSGEAQVESSASEIQGAREAAGKKLARLRECIAGSEAAAAADRVRAEESSNRLSEAKKALALVSRASDVSDGWHEDGRSRQLQRQLDTVRREVRSLQLQLANAYWPGAAAAADARDAIVAANSEAEAAHADRLRVEEQTAETLKEIARLHAVASERAKSHEKDVATTDYQKTDAELDTTEGTDETADDLLERRADGEAESEDVDVAVDDVVERILKNCRENEEGGAAKDDVESNQDETTMDEERDDLSAMVKDRIEDLDEEDELDRASEERQMSQLEGYANGKSEDEENFDVAEQVVIAPFATNSETKDVLIHSSPMPRRRGNARAISNGAGVRGGRGGLRKKLASAVSPVLNTNPSNGGYLSTDCDESVFAEFDDCERHLEDRRSIFFAVIVTVQSILLLCTLYFS
eukprot:TRINITY_DN20935_c0_g1_i1.p1 TRINITY_DN20935_c0_g1~~TRINITY_DN20935_c0_g1_i1.p1  ORF type:complete len:576 (+),score=123.15 TRINITY_DN20935_c0_g1_i1:152-1879(+)